MDSTNLVSLFSSLIAGLLTLIAGYVAALVSRSKDLQKKNLDRIEDKVASTKSPVLKSAKDQDSKQRELIISGDVINSTLILDQASWSVVEDLVNDYHQQALSQARVQFWFSIGAASIGFGLIIYMLLKTSSGNISTTVIGTLPGIAIDAVAALFFKQAGETRERATALYDRLRTDKEKSQATILVESISNQNVRDAVKAGMVLHMSGLEVEQFNSMIPKLTGAESSKIALPTEEQ